MKTLVLFIILSIAPLFYSQISIGKEIPSDHSILDFGTDNNKGIVLPYVTNLDENSVPGTFYFDAHTSKVMFLCTYALDLSVKNISAANAFNLNAEEYVHLVEENIHHALVIGSETTTAPGVMVLESTDKAMILPIVSSFNNVGDPAPGTIVYDSSTKLLCVYDGEKWSFWAAEES